MCVCVCVCVCVSQANPSLPQTLEISKVSTCVKKALRAGSIARLFRFCPLNGRLGNSDREDSDRFLTVYRFTPSVCRDLTKGRCPPQSLVIIHQPPSPVNERSLHQINGWVFQLGGGRFTEACRGCFFSFTCLGCFSCSWSNGACRECRGGSDQSPWRRKIVVW